MSSHLYSDAIKQLARAQREQTPLKQIDVKTTLDNPLCGDRITTHIKLKEGRISHIYQHVQGCLLCNASANILTRLAIGRNQTQFEQGSRHLAEFLNSSSKYLPKPWQEFSMFEPARYHKNRHTCIELPLQAILQSLE